MKAPGAIVRPVRAVVVAALVIQLTACGTLLYPERHGFRGQRVDSTVLIMDGALLLFFVVPGLVAFAIDFHTGALYVPESGGRVSSLRVDPRELSVARIEQILREHTGSEVRLDDPHLRVRRIPAETSPEEALRAVLETAGS